MKNVFLIFSLFLCFSSKGQSGLYLKLQFFGNNLDIEWLYFQDTLLVKNPKYGITPLQFEKERLANKENIARIISASNTKMAIQWGNSIQEFINLKIQNNELVQFKGVDCIKAKPIDKKYFNDKLYSGLVNFNNLSKDIQLFLDKDGKFSLTTKSPKGVTQKEEGTYVVSGNVIVFTNKEGKTWQHFVHPFESATEDIIVDQQLYKQIQEGISKL